MNDTQYRSKFVGLFSTTRRRNMAPAYRHTSTPFRLETLEARVLLSADLGGAIPVAEILKSSTFGVQQSVIQNVQPAQATPTSSSISGAINLAQVSLSSGYAYVARQDFGTPGDTNDAPTASVLRVFEDGRELGPAHSQYVDIEQSGGGRFTHYETALWFSASDNSNPLTNGRSYTYQVGTATTVAPTPSPTPTPTPSPTPQAGETLKTDLGVYPEPALPAMGPAGSKVVDPTFGTTILRLTDGADGNVDSLTTYAYNPVFNANNTRLYTQSLYPGNAVVFYDFDPVNFSAGNRRVASSPSGGLITYDMQWSGTNPDVIYGHGYTELVAYNAATNSYTTLKNFANDVPSGGYLDQMSMSRNDDVFAFSLADSSGAHVGYLAWQRSTNQTLLKQFNSMADEVQVDKSGQYMTMVSTDGNSQVWNLQTGQMTQLTWGVNGYFHYDTGHGTIFTGNGAGSGLAYRSLATPQTYTNILDGYFAYAGMNYSTNADNGLWAVVETHNMDGSSVSKPFDNEIVQVATDGSNRVRRIAHHRSVSNDYLDQPNANVSRDGQFVAFNSNWGNANGRRDVYIVKLPPAPTV